MDGSDTELNHTAIDVKETKVDISLTTFSVEKHNKSILRDLRKQIDHPINENKLESELELYSNKEGGREALVVSEGFKPIGYVEIKLSESPPEEAIITEDLSGYAELARIGVLKETDGVELRKKGVGRRLMEEAEKLVLSKGKKGLWLEYRNDNPNAKPFYEKMGYVVVNEFTDSQETKRILVKKDIVKDINE